MSSVFKVISHRKTLFFIILITGGLLRFSNLDWGLPQGTAKFDLPHPDEHDAVLSVSQMSLSDLDFTPDNTLYEGPLSYQIIKILQVGGQTVGFIPDAPSTIDLNCNNEYYQKTLVTGRFFFALMDFIAIIVLYQLLVLICKSRWLPLLGAIFYAASPFVIQHIHYMRSHNLISLLILLTTYLSIKYIQTKNLKTAILIGITLAITTFCRYPFAIISLIPFFLLSYDFMFATGQKQNLLVRLFKASTQKGIIVMGISFLTLSILFAIPILLDLNKFIEGFSMVKGYTLEYEFAGWKNKFDLTRPSHYFKTIIPHAIGWLFIPTYIGVLFLFLFKKSYNISIPIIIFITLLLYPITKGYPIYAMRVILPIIPLLFLLAMLFLDELLSKYRRTGLLASIVFSIAIIPTLFFSIATVKALGKKHPYQQFQEVLNSIPKDNKTMLVVAPEWEWKEINNFKKIVKSTNNQSIRFLDSLPRYDSLPDLIVLHEFEKSESLQSLKEKQLEKLSFLTGYKKLKKIKVKIDLLNWEFNYDSQPHDFHYPFPEITVYLKQK